MKEEGFLWTWPKSGLEGEDGFSILLYGAESWTLTEMWIYQG